VGNLRQPFIHQPLSKPDQIKIPPFLFLWSKITDKTATKLQIVQLFDRGWLNKQQVSRF
jgi:hypothetical protein